MRRLRFGISLTITLVMLLLSCCTPPQTTLMRLVPLESCAVMSIDWSAIRSDSELRRAINGDQINRLLRELGVDSDSLDTVAVFSTLDSRAAGLLLRGSFDAHEITGELGQRGWAEELLDARTAYVKAAHYVLAVPSTKTLFTGTRDGALAVLRATANAKHAIVASDVYQKLNDALSTNHTPVKAFLVIPQGTLDMADAALTATSVALSLFSLGGIGQLLQTVNVARGFGFSLDRGRDQVYPVELCVLMRDEQSAVFVSGSLNALKAISELAATDSRNREQLRAIREMSIVRKQEVLAIKMAMPGTALLPPATTNRGLNN